MGWLRVAGTGRSLDDDTVTWSVAEGRRGRRWREAVTRDGAVVHSLLLEMDAEGRFAHLELTTPAGLLTLHPEGDATLHGNAITGGGITHVRGLPWESDDVVVVEGSVVCRAVAGAWKIARGLDQLGSVRIALDLSLARDPSAIVAAPADVRGLPLLEGGRQWPLEEA